MIHSMLPILGEERERCDAARNRALLLGAAARLVSEVGADALTMDAVAAAAGVGKGTVFRRFGSRSGLMQALLDHTEIELQQKFLFGSPPLGPGAEPIERLVAFGRARLASVEVQGEVMRAVEHSSEFRYATPTHGVNFTHVSTLLRQAAIDADIDMLTFALLSQLDATLVLHQLRDRHISMTRIADGWEELVRRATRSPHAPATTIEA